MEASDAMNIPESLNDRTSETSDDIYSESEEKRIDIIFLKSAIGRLAERASTVLRYLRRSSNADRLGIFGPGFEDRKRCFESQREME